MAPPPAARRLARFVVDLSLDRVPPAVTAQASLLALDTLGNALAATREDFGRAVLDVAERLGGLPESALLGHRGRVSAASAVLANATLAHGLDFDDTREDAIVHTGCVAVTTALAVGEATGASGRAVLEALIAAVEVMCRIGLAVPGALHARHFHPTSITSTFAAAAAAGRLHGLDETRLVHAFGICGSQSAGIIEYLADGSWTKRLHPGWGAHAGVTAALLARAGFTGPESVLEGTHGLYAAFAGGHDAGRLDGLLDSLGTTWELAELTLKPYPCGSIAQPYMDCAMRLRDRAHPRRSARSAVARRRGRCRGCGSRWPASTRRPTATRPSSACHTCWRRSSSGAARVSPNSPTTPPATRRCWRSPGRSATSWTPRSTTHASSSATSRSP
jgi:2-methylcitrate dehydratase PrpD